jgi:hypothetical protein
VSLQQELILITYVQVSGSFNITGYYVLDLYCNEHVKNGSLVTADPNVGILPVPRVNTESWQEKVTVNSLYTISGFDTFTNSC